jgi:hypothetical protein
MFSLICGHLGEKSRSKVIDRGGTTKEMKKRRNGGDKRAKRAMERQI